MNNKSRKYMSSVKVGPKGQVVIPKLAREMFNISPGDMLLLLADSKKGISIMRYDMFEKFSDAMLSEKAKDSDFEKSEKER